MFPICLHVILFSKGVPHGKTCVTRGCALLGPVKMPILTSAFHFGQGMPPSPFGLCRQTFNYTGHHCIGPPAADFCGA